MVGDFQQSIYGRRADLKQYADIHQALLESAGAEKLEFSVTFRLDQKQVDCLNKIFDRILNNRAGQVSFVKLDPRPEVLPGQIIRLDLNADGVGEKAKMREKADAEATQLANWLRGISLEQLRARTWRDVAVLCPRKKWLRTISHALRRAGFSVQIQSESEVKADSPAYAWFTALCTIMTDPVLSYEIAGVLREVFGLSDHDLAVFAQGYGDRFQIVEPATQTGIVAETLALLAQTRASIAGLPLFTAIGKMVERTQLRARLTSLPREDFEGLERELDALLASAATAEAEGKTLAQFAELLRGNFEAEREIRPSDEQAIQLITSYKAKGSEWQAVIVPFLAREVRGARPSYPTVIKVPFSGELTVALDSDDVSQEVKDEVLQFEQQEMERLLYVAITRARHTLVLAFDEKIFAKTSGEVSPKSQLHWLQGHRGGANEPELAALPKELTICAATQARQGKDSEGNAGAGLPAFPQFQPNEIIDATARASEFVHKRNPSELATQFRILSGVAVDLWNETDPELRPLVQETPATRYGLWWHTFVQRLPWQSEDLLLPNSPDPARSAREWALLRKQLTSSTDLRAALLNPEAILHPEFPFLWRLDESNCVEGVIDLALFDRAGKWLIIDWKTNRIAPNESETLRELYRPQVAAYWKAVREMTRLPVEAAIYSTPTGTLLRYSADELGTEWEKFLD
jgi:ATP-dependent exoDNAse (exonuclease V) beta subunit